MTIKSKIFNYGDEKESDWPPMFGNPGRGAYYYDEDLKKVVEGYPPDPNPKIGIAPQVIFDSIKPTYHEGACRVIESRKEWEQADKEHNTITFGNINEPRKYAKKGAEAEKKAYKADIQQAKKQAIKAYEANPKEVRAKLNHRAEEQEKSLTKTEKKELNRQLKQKGII